MSYNVYLTNREGETIYFEDPHMFTGGTYAENGTREAWLNVTYNYTPIINGVFKEVGLGDLGLRGLNGKTVAETIDKMITAMYLLNPETVSFDYWEPTEGNVGLMLAQLNSLALKITDTQNTFWKVD